MLYTTCVVSWSNDSLWNANVSIFLILGYYFIWNKEGRPVSCWCQYSIEEQEHHNWYQSGHKLQCQSWLMLYCSNYFKISSYDHLLDVIHDFKLIKYLQAWFFKPKSDLWFPSLILDFEENTVFCITCCLSWIILYLHNFAYWSWAIS